MLMIRLQRIGRKHDPAFRAIVTEKTAGPKAGKYIEKVGFYHAKTGERSFKKERILYWIGKGAQLSDTMHNFLISEKVIEGKKIAVLSKQKTGVQKEGIQKSNEEKPMKNETPKNEAAQETAVSPQIIDKTNASGV